MYSSMQIVLDKAKEERQKLLLQSIGRFKKQCALYFPILYKHRNSGKVPQQITFSFRPKWYYFWFNITSNEEIKFIEGNILDFYKSFGPYKDYVDIYLRPKTSKIEVVCYSDDTVSRARKAETSLSKWGML